jgi:hypothetical protein
MEKPLSPIFVFDESLGDVILSAMPWLQIATHGPYLGKIGKKLQ